MIRYGTLTEIWCLAPCYHNMFFWILEPKRREGSRRFQREGLQVLKGFVSIESVPSDPTENYLEKADGPGKTSPFWESAALRVVNSYFHTAWLVGVGVRLSTHLSVLAIS